MFRGGVRKHVQPTHSFDMDRFARMTRTKRDECSFRLGMKTMHKDSYSEALFGLKIRAAAFLSVASHGSGAQDELLLTFAAIAFWNQ